jgi:hypothetical protein
MAKSIKILNPAGILETFTEGVLDCVKIVVKYSFSNVVDVVIYFGSLPKVQYYQCPCMVGDNFTWNPPTPTSNYYLNMISYSAAELAANTSKVFIPAPPVGFKSSPIGFVLLFSYVAPQFTESVFGSMLLSSNGINSSTGILTSTNIKGTANISLAASRLISSNYYPSQTFYTTDVHTVIGWTVSAGGGSLVIYSAYSVIPA